MQMTLSLLYHSLLVFSRFLVFLCLLAFCSILQEIYRRATDKKKALKTTTMGSTTDYTARKMWIEQKHLA